MLDFSKNPNIFPDPPPPPKKKKCAPWPLFQTFLKPFPKSVREGLKKKKKKKKKVDRGRTFRDPPPHWDVDRLMWYFFTYFFNANKKNSYGS